MLVEVPVHVDVSICEHSRLTFSGLHLVEIGLDTRARLVKLGLWLKGLRERGLRGAADAAAGLA